jgi:hypothetical protein
MGWRGLTYDLAGDEVEGDLPENTKLYRELIPQNKPVIEQSRCVTISPLGWIHSYLWKNQCPGCEREPRWYVAVTSGLLLLMSYPTQTNSGNTSHRDVSTSSQQKGGSPKRRLARKPGRR